MPRRSMAVLFVILGVLSTTAMETQAAVTKEQASRQIEEAFGVEVLKARPGKIDGRDVWLLTVMNRGGNFNGAFQFNTLAVDQASGALVPSFRHGPSGYTLPEAGDRSDKDGLRPDAARTRTWR